jgi:hypothetical protein
VNFASIFEASRCVGSNVAIDRWAAHLYSRYGSLREVAIAELLLDIAQKPELDVLYRQLLYGLSLKLTDVYGKLAQADEKEKKHSPAKWVWQKPFSKRGGFEMEHRLAAYVANCVIAGRGHAIWGASTDERKIHVMPLMNTLLGLPNNVLMLACPQVVVGGGWVVVGVCAHSKGVLGSSSSRRAGSDLYYRLHTYTYTHARTHRERTTRDSARENHTHAQTAWGAVCFVGRESAKEKWEWCGGSDGSGGSDGVISASAAAGQ